MKLSGNIQIEQRGEPQIDTTEGQLIVTISYRASGVDLSDGNEPLENPEEDAEAADALVDQAKNEIRAHFTNYLDKGKFKEFQGPLAILNSSHFIGFDCNVTIYGVDGLESLKNCTLDIDAISFYDFPKNDMAVATQTVTEELFKKN